MNPFGMAGGMFGNMFNQQQPNDPHQEMLKNNRAAKQQRMNPGQNMQAAAPQQGPGQMFGQMFQNWQQSNPMGNTPMGGMFANVFNQQGNNGLNPQQQQQMNVDRAKYGLAPGQTLGGQGWQSQAGNQNPYQPQPAPQAPQPTQPQTTGSQQQTQSKPNTRGNYSR
jgi:hypothetical protein